MVDLPYESLIGVSYGLLTGFVPALVVGLAAVGIGIGTDRSLPVAAGLATVPVAIGTGTAAGVFDPDPGTAAALSRAYRIAMAAIVAGTLGVLAASQGNRIATELPRDRALPIVRGQALSGDAIDAVDAMGQVTIRSTGSIREFEGYPSLSPALRRGLAEGSWRFPADLQLAELERRLERRLRTAYGLSSVDVSVDGRGRATITAAPPTRGVATTLPDGKRAVTVAGLLPTGIEPGDRVAIGVADTAGDDTDDTEPIQGEVLAISGESDTSISDRGFDGVPSAATVDSIVASSARRAADAGFDGGPGRLTVAVETAAAGPLLEAERHRIAVLPSGERPAFEAAALLSAAGQPVTACEEPADAGDAVETLAVHDGDEWEVVVDGDFGANADASDAADTGESGVASTPADRAFVARSARTQDREVER